MSVYKMLVVSVIYDSNNYGKAALKYLGLIQIDMCDAKSSVSTLRAISAHSIF